MASKDIKDLSLRALQGEVSRRRKQVDKLRNRRAKLAAQLEELEQRIASHPGSAVRPGSVSRARAKPGGEASSNTRAGVQGGGPLADMLHEVLSSDEPTTVMQAAEKARKAGYQTRAKNFRATVSQALNRDPRFERVGRGQYVRVG